MPGQSGATSAAAWLAHHTRTRRVTAHRTMRLAQGLERHHLTRTALAGGRVRVEQAEEVLRALAQLPATLAAARMTGPARTTVPRARTTYILRSNPGNPEIRRPVRPAGIEPATTGL